MWKPGVNDPIRTLLKTTASVVGIRIRWAHKMADMHAGAAFSCN